jgi:hypothetical protein
MGFKHKLILIVFCLTVKFSQAQIDSLFFKKVNGLFFSTSGGFSIPIGNFAKYEQKSNNTYGVANFPGVPKVGQNGKAELMYMPFKNFGFTCTYYASFNKADTLGQGRFFPSTSGGGNGGGWVMTSYNYNTTNWQTKNLLLGIAAQINTNKSFKIRFKISGGFQQVKSPNLHAVSTGYIWYFISMNPNIVKQTPYTLSCTQSGLTSYNFVFGAGIDIRACLKNGFGIILSMDYLNSVAHFNGDFITDYNDGTSNSGITKTSNSSTKNLSMVLFNAGISYEIKNLKRKK